MLDIHEPDPGRLADLSNHTVAVIGYGNQGRAHALNLRDSGVSVIVGNRADTYASTAAADGFAVDSIAAAAAAGTIVALLLPDDVQPEVFDEVVRPALWTGDAVLVASGYTLFYAQLALPPDVDAVMVAPRMVGDNVRDRYVSGAGSPSFVSVEQDATGTAANVVLAYAEAIGCTRGGCFTSSAREEVALDLFGEQALWPAILQMLEIAYEVLCDKGFSDIATLYELYLSGEPAEIFANAARLGLLGQLSMHSPASQMGQLQGQLPPSAADTTRRFFRDVLDGDILDGEFATSWSERTLEDHSARLEHLRADAAARPMHAAERKVRAHLDGSLIEGEAS